MEPQLYQKMASKIDSFWTKAFAHSSKNYIIKN